MDIKVDKNTVIVFDLDDTLYNEIDFLKSAYIAIAKDLKPKNWEHLFSLLFSLYRNDKNVFAYVSENFDITQSELIERYRNHKPNIKPFQGVLEEFKNIKNKKAKIAILTDGRKTTQRNKIAALGLSPYIDYIVISEEIGTEKPNKNNFAAIEREFKLSKYYYIGDNFKKDFITPKKMGWQTIALIDNGLNIHSNAYSHDSQEYLPQGYVHSFNQLNFL